MPQHVAVRFRPTVFFLLPVLVTRFKGIPLFVGRGTDPTKRTTGRKTRIISLRGHDEALRGGGGRRRAATTQPMSRSFLTLSYESLSETLSLLVYGGRVRGSLRPHPDRAATRHHEHHHTRDNSNPPLPPTVTPGRRRWW